MSSPKYPFNPRRFSDTMSVHRKPTATRPQLWLMFHLNFRRIPYTYEHPVERPNDEDGNPQFPFRIDVLVHPDVGVEVKGAIHEKAKKQRNDEKREAYIETQGIRIISFTNRQVFDDVNECIDRIVAFRDGAK